MRNLNRTLAGVAVCHLLGLCASLPAADVDTEVCVVGAGAGGIGAALAAAREGAQVVLIEKQDMVGGTMTSGLVSIWGGGPGDTIARELYETLAARGAAGVARRVGKIPYHCWEIAPELTYESSTREKSHRVIFDPAAMHKASLDSLAEHAVDVRLRTTFEEAETEGRRVTAVKVRRADGTVDRIRASVFVDATGDVYVCRSAGCETEIGKNLNGVTLCYRVTKGKEEEPQVLSAKPFRRTSCNHQLPNGDRIINMLPTVEGKKLLELGYGKTLAACRALVYQHWAWLRHGPGSWRRYRFAEFASLLGIREGYRIRGEYILNASDLSAGFHAQKHPDMIALAAHRVDVHGSHRGVKRMAVKPYGIPYRCLIPKGWQNILVACRGASFDRAAASSARLSRTIMALGHAAGTGAAMAARRGIPVAGVDVAAIIQQVDMTPASVTARLGAVRSSQPAATPKATVIGEMRHAFVCTDNGRGEILRFDKQGKLVWTYPAPRCQDVWGLANDNILFTSFTNEGSTVTEIAPGKEVVRQVKLKGEVHSCQPLPDGGLLIGECGACRLVRVDCDGRIVKATPVISKVKNPHSHMRQMRITSRGTMLVSHPKESVVREYDADGRVVRSIKKVGQPFAAIPLPNGNTLVAGGGKPMVTEVDPTGKVVWRLKPADVPEVSLKWVAGLQRLPNGNTIVCNWLGHGQAGKGVPLFEVTPDKKVVWMFTDAKTTRSVSSVCLLDVPNPIR